jgi:hypothetical protein
MLTDGALENAHAGKRTAFVGLRSHAAITKELELQLQQRFCLITLFEDVAQYAAGFYESLRECDRNQVELIVVQRSPDTGVGEALAERQRRACG